MVLPFKFNSYGIGKGIFCSLLAFALFFGGTAEAQWFQPKRVKFGLSGGFGGLHEWGKPSFDIHKGRSTLRLAPGLYYMSVGITQKVAWFRPKHRKDRVVIMNLAYHNDYFLSDVKDEFKDDVHAIMVLPGLHMNLNHRGTYYFQVSAGVAYAHERWFDGSGNVFRRNNHFLPMGEIRIGGIILSRKEHHQEFYMGNPPVRKIKKSKLKFK